MELASAALVLAAGAGTINTVVGTAAARQSFPFHRGALDPACAQPLRLRLLALLQPGRSTSWSMTQRANRRRSLRFAALCRNRLFT